MNRNTKYICDTNILLSSLLSKTSPPALTIDYIRKYGMFSFSQETLTEFEEVLKRPKFDKFLSIETRQNFINEIFELSVFYEVKQKLELCRDPKDNKFLDVAISSSADYLITGDDDLLVLDRIDHTAIITPREFIDSIMN